MLDAIPFLFVGFLSFGVGWFLCCLHHDTLSTPRYRRVRVLKRNRLKVVRTPIRREVNPAVVWVGMVDPSGPVAKAGLQYGEVDTV